MDSLYKTLVTHKALDILCIHTEVS